MPGLEKLKDKWFLDVLLDGQFPPQTRHPGTKLQPCTDGNLVEPIIDGAALMSEFYQRVEAMINAPDPAQHHLWLAQWKTQPVKLLGETQSAPDAETEIIRAAEAGAKVYFLGSAHTGQDFLSRKFAKKLLAAGGQGASDKRIPFFGSQHQKFYIFRGPGNNWVAISGSADLNYSRWDTPKHLENEPDRSRLSDGPSHDVSLRVKGPAVHDIALTFAERWNDRATHSRTHPQIKEALSTDFLAEAIPPAGPHSVQLLRTYGQEKKRGFSWASQGEFTIWAAYLNAIRQARNYIYIEDQYFYSFHNPPAFQAPAGKLRDSDLVYQLGQAIKRGVDVVLLAPSRKGSRNPSDRFQLYSRKRAADYLRQMSKTSSHAGRFLASYLIAGKTDPVIHSKTMIVDDEFALVGSANVCQRSMTYDTEVHLGVVDAENRLARDLRIALWQEHLNMDNPAMLREPSAAIDYFYNHAAGKHGRLRFLETTPGAAAPFHNLVMNNFMDPYGGPPRD